jgi:hypothetical protein
MDWLRALQDVSPECISLQFKVIGCRSMDIHAVDVDKKY